MSTIIENRLRSFVNLLKERPIETSISQSQWESLVDQAELTKNDLDKLAAKRNEHLAYAKGLASKGLFDEAVEEWTAAIQLFPADFDTLKAVMDSLALNGYRTPAMRTLQKILLSRRQKLTSKRSQKRSGFLLLKQKKSLVFSFLALILILGVVSQFLQSPEKNILSTPSKPESPGRKLLFTIDTHGIKTQTEGVNCQVLSYPDAQFIEAKAWVSFPENKITHWVAESLILDDHKKILSQETIILHPEHQIPLEAGQGIGFFQRYEASNWFNQATEIFLRTVSLKVKGVEQTNKKNIPLNGHVPEGFALDVFLLENSWNNFFDRFVNRLNFEVKNSGLKSITDLRLDLVWKNTFGEVLKTKPLKIVQVYRMALLPGARLPFGVQGEFPTEVFSWGEDQEPQISVVLKEIQ